MKRKKARREENEKKKNQGKKKSMKTNFYCANMSVQNFSHVSERRPKDSQGTA